ASTAPTAPGTSTGSPLTTTPRSPNGPLNAPPHATCGTASPPDENACHTAVEVTPTAPPCPACGWTSTSPAPATAADTHCPPTSTPRRASSCGSLNSRPSSCIAAAGCKHGGCSANPCPSTTRHRRCSPDGEQPGPRTARNTDGMSTTCSTSPGSCACPAP